MKSVLANRICKICGMAAHVTLKKHCHGDHKTEGKVLPKKLHTSETAANSCTKAEREKAIIALNDNVEVADWMDDIDVRGITISG